MKSLLLFSLLVLFPINLFALRFSLNPGQDVVGMTFAVQAEPGESLDQVGERYGLGLHEMIEANPGLNQEQLFGGEEVVIPAEFVLPKYRKGIVINTAELRLYYFNGGEVLTYPVGLGREGWRTPTASTTIIRKTVYPVWTVPSKIRSYVLEQTGRYLPNSIPPGPENPLGPYAMYLGTNGYLIHGTNQPWSIGKLISAGCIRMYNKDVEELYHHVSVGTPVKIVHHPYKAGWNHGKLYLEAHIPVRLEEKATELNTTPVKMVLKNSLHKNTYVDWNKLDDVLREKRGLPENIGCDRDSW